MENVHGRKTNQGEVTRTAAVISQSDRAFACNRGAVGGPHRAHIDNNAALRALLVASRVQPSFENLRSFHAPLATQAGTYFRQTVQL